MNNLTPTVTIEGFRACLLEDGKVPIFDGPQPLGRATWNSRQRRIDDFPDAVPEKIRKSLSQGLRMAILTIKVNKEEKRRVTRFKVSRPSTNTLFREFKERAFPSNFTRWIKVVFRQTFVAIVIAEQEVMFYRNWIFIGQGRWNPNIQFVEQYRGEPIPSNVWESIAQGLTEYVVARAKG